MTFSVIIPARYHSQRLPGKPLMDIAGKTMIQRVYEQANLSDAEQVVIATDDQRIADAVHDFGGISCMTSTNHESGTDRLQEAAMQLGLTDDHVVVNVQGDEPLIPAGVINQVADNLNQSTCRIATLCEKIQRIEEVFDPNVVKVVTDQQSRAIYFSRAPIPWAREEFNKDHPVASEDCRHYRHLGIYAYRVAMLNDFVRWVQSPIEKAEKLEQLRAMWHGDNIHVGLAKEKILPGVDTLEDLNRVRDLLHKDH